MGSKTSAPKYVSTVRVKTTAPRSSDKWNAELIVQKIRTLHRQNKPIWSRQIRLTNAPLFAACIHWFGTYKNAVEAAGIEYESIQKTIPGRWTTGTVRRELRRIYKNKQPMHHAALERDHPSLVVAAYRCFGSYGSAVTAAGLNYDRIRVRPMPTWDKQRVVSRLKELEKARTGLWKRSVRRVDPYLDRAADRCFGSYAKAVRASGVSADLLKPPPYRFWSPQRIVDQLKETYQKNPRLLKPSRLVGKKGRLLRACRRRFGSYRLALDAAGIAYGEVVMPPAMTAPEIIAKLSSLFEAGKDLRYSHLRQTKPAIIRRIAKNVWQLSKGCTRCRHRLSPRSADAALDGQAGSEDA